MLYNRTGSLRRLQIELIHGFDRERARRMRRFNRILNMLRDATNYGNKELINNYVVDGEYRTASIFSSGVNNFLSYSIDVIVLLRPNAAYFIDDTLWRSFLLLINALLRHPTSFAYLFNGFANIRINLIGTLYYFLFREEIPNELSEGIFAEFEGIQLEYNRYRDHVNRQNRAARNNRRNRR
jgi:hypothetical protein